MGKKRTATRFLKTVSTALHEKSLNDARLQPFITVLDEALANAIGKSPGKRPNCKALDCLPGLLDAAAGEGEDFQAMLRATAVAAQWLQIYVADEVGQDLADGMTASQVVGNNGLLRSERLITGFFLIGPNVDYPMHDHLADEVYLVVSGAVNIQNGFDAQPRRVSAGDYSITPSGMPHAMRTGNEPVLMIYIWTGQVACDFFWWEHQGTDLWRRYIPTLCRAEIGYSALMRPAADLLRPGPD